MPLPRLYMFSTIPVVIPWLTFCQGTATNRPNTGQYFDYGAPVGFRLAVRHPDQLTAIISQNGNAYEEGLSDGWNPIRAYWQDPSPPNREALRSFLAPETTLWQYTHGVPDVTAISPDGYSLDNFYLARPRADEVQLDLFGDYKSNVALYPTFQNYFRTHKPPFLAVWGKNDPFFLPPGAEAFKRDIPDAVVRFFDTGHFALETHAAEIAAASNCIEIGTSIPRAFAVFMLMTSSNLVGCTTGSSAGFSPLRIRPARIPAWRYVSPIWGP